MCARRRSTGGRACVLAALGLAFLSLEVRVSNEAAIRLYEGKGFVRAGIRPGYYERRAEDALIMNLSL